MLKQKNNARVLIKILTGATIIAVIVTESYFVAGKKKPVLSNPGSIDTEKLQKGYSLLATSKIPPAAPVIHGSLDSLVTFLSMEPEKAVYAVCSLEKDGSIEELGRFPIPVYSEKDTETVTIVRGVPHFSATSGDMRYDHFAVHEEDPFEGMRLLTRVYEFDVKKALKKKGQPQRVQPQLIYYDGRHNKLIVFPAVADKKHLVLEDGEEGQFLIINLKEARQLAKKGSCLTYYDESVKKVPFGKKYTQNKDVERIIEEYLKKTFTIREFNYYLTRRKKLKMRLNDIYGNFGVCVARRKPSAKDKSPYAIIGVNLEQINYK